MVEVMMVTDGDSDGDARSAGNVIEVIKHGRMRDERREEAELEWLGRAVHH